MGGAIKSEIRKIFTTRLWWGLLIGVVIIGAGLSALFAAQVGTDGQSDDSPLRSANAEAAQAVYSAGFITLSLAALLPLALGVILITSEFRHHTWTSTTLAQPRRWQITVSKLAAIAVIGFVYAVVYDVSVLIGGGLVLKLAKHGSPFITDGAVLQTLALMIVAFILWITIGFGFGLLVRNQIAAVFIALGLAFIGTIVFEIVFSLLHWDGAGRFLPNSLVAGMLNPKLHANSPSDSFAWWVCLLLFAGYSLALATAGSVVSQRKDVL